MHQLTAFQTGQIRKPDDIPKDDFRSTLPRFQPENFDKNLKLVDKLQELAKQKGCTAGQMSLAWVRAHSGKEGLPTIIPIPGATTADRVRENMQEVELSEEDMKQIDGILASTVVIGDRYGGHAAALMNG